jgi:hypothetical protein
MSLSEDEPWSVLTTDWECVVSARAPKRRRPADRSQQGVVFIPMTGALRIQEAKQLRLIPHTQRRPYSHVAHDRLGNSGRKAIRRVMAPRAVLPEDAGARIFMLLRSMRRRGIVLWLWAGRLSLLCRLRERNRAGKQ